MACKQIIIFILLVTEIWGIILKIFDKIYFKNFLLR
jgi:hypothetical protein